MGLMKINQILKKYKELHKNHKDSWKDAQKRIRAKSPDGVYHPDGAYIRESYKYNVEGNRLLDELMKELEGHEIFPKKNNNN